MRAKRSAALKARSKIPIILSPIIGKIDKEMAYKLHKSNFIIGNLNLMILIGTRDSPSVSQISTDPGLSYLGCWQQLLGHLVGSALSYAFVQVVQYISSRPIPFQIERILNTI